MSVTGLEIAVIGMSGRFPGASGIDEFWENLENGVESLSFFTDEELEKAGVEPSRFRDPNYVKAGGGRLQAPDEFDAPFFDYTPNEAVVMHPQVRLFHECAWEALENAGYNPGSYKEKIGLYAGASSAFSWQTRVMLSGRADRVGLFAAAGLADKDNLCTRVSYKLDLKGPALIVQSACSTSLAAVDLACRGIWTGQCGMALAGGVSVADGDTRGYIYKEGMIRPPDGHCRAFDAKAKGTVSGEGVGVVVLKLLEDARSDGDTILAVIKGSAVNNDGNRKVGYTAPGVEGQAEVIRAAHLMAEIPPETVTYIETHGTGTPLGDPVEIEALKQGFGTDKKGFCRLGTLKPNIGHLDAAAGIAGFIKAVLVLVHRRVPPCLHVETPNPAIDFDNTPFYVNTTLTPWENKEHPLRAGVSSFGIGGTNAHVVLEECSSEHSSNAERTAHSIEHQLLLLSAKTETALEKMTANLLNYLKGNKGNIYPISPIGHINPPSLADIAYTLQVGRNAFRHRKMLVCSDVDEAVDALSTPGSEKVFSYLAGEKPPSAVFMFPGQGSQYVDMGRELYQKENTFREAMDRCFKILAPLMEGDLKEILYPNLSTPPIGSPRRGVDRTEFAQPLIFAVEYALAKLLMKWGIRPHAMIGHSIGEYVAAHLSGVFSLEDTLKIVVLRGKLMQQLPAGAMLGVSVSPGELKPLLESHPALSLAAVNSPGNCTVSGPHDAVEDFEQRVKECGFQCRRLHTSHAFHSAMMDPVLETFKDELRRITPGKPTIPYPSNVTGKWITPADIANPAYWATHLRHTVRFSDGIEALTKKGESIFLEVGPGRVLTTFVKKIAGAPGHLSLNLLRHPGEDTSDIYILYREIGKMWLFGGETDWRVFHNKGERRRIPLPTYPFERQCFRIDEGGTGVDRPGPLKHGKSTAAGIRPPLSQWFYLPAWKRDIPIRGGISAAGETDETENWLVFLDSCALGNLLVLRLQALNHCVETVAPGTEFAVPGEDRTVYTLNPRNPGDYRQLFRHLESQNKAPHRILHLWSITGPHPPSGTGDQFSREEFEQAQYPGFYSLLYIAKAVGKTGTGLSRSLQVDVISDYLFDVTGNEDLVPAKSTMKGALAVIPQEHPNIRCRAIDILLPDAQYPQNPQWERLVIQLLDEILSEREPGDTTAAFRGPHRLVQVFDPFPLETVEALPLVEKGVYLITGGLGKIGLTLARFLARDYGARLVLIDRFNELGEKETKAIEELRTLGAEVLAFGVDVADEEQMRSVVKEVERQWNTVNGVLHIAGMVRGRSFDLVDALEPAACREQFQAKVYGTVALEKLFRDKPLAFCWFMSSVSVVLGGLRFSAYAAANACMDALVSQVKRRGGAGGNWIGVDWDGLSPHQTVEAFKRILSLPLRHIDRMVVSNGGNLQERINQWIRLETLREETNTGEENTITLYPRPQLFNPYIAPSTKTQHALADTWKRLFGFEKIGIADDFFQLGGDSLKAVTVISTIHKALAVEIPLPVFFSNPTIKKLAEYIDRTGTGTYTGVPPAEKKEYYPLSPGQMRLFLLQQMDTESTAYNEMQWTVFERPVDPAAIRDIFERMIRRHDIYRTSITFVEGEPVQRVHPHVDFDLQFSDISTGEGDEREHVGRAIAAFRKPFDTAKPPLLRVLLVKAGERRHILVMDQHHLVTDGISHLIFMREVAALYEGKELPPLHLQYKDYVEWVNRPRQRSALQKQEMYWLEQFRDDIPVLALPLDYPRPAVRSFEGRSAAFSLTEGETRGLHALAAREDATLYMVLLSMLNVLAAKLSGGEDIVLGTVVAGRRHEDLSDIMGMFVNTLALRNRPSGERSFAAFLKEVKTNTLDAFENQEYPFELLVEKVNVVKDTSRNPLFDIMFVLQTQAEKNTGNAASETWKPAVDRVRAVKFDLTLEGVESDGRLTFRMEYCTQLFKPETVTRFIAYFKNIAAYVLDNPAAAIFDIDILPSEEKQRLLFEFNDTIRHYPSGKTVHQLFEERALRTPDGIAVNMSDKTHATHLTYTELNRKSDRLASLLREKGVGPDTVVGIKTERSPDTIAGIMGILKAGGAYLPIDPGYPEERINYILRDSNAGVLLTDRELSGGISAANHVISLRGTHPALRAPLPGGDLPWESAPGNFTFEEGAPAYVIYTSGTTGRPRGVMVRHFSLVNFVYDMAGNYNRFDTSDRGLCLTNFCFDVSVCEIFLPLAFGAAIVLLPDDRMFDPVELAGTIVKYAVTFTYLPPGLLEEIYRNLKPYRDNLSLNKMLVGVEPIKDDVLENYLTLNRNMRVVNGYGPTEATICASTYRYVSREPEGRRVPIGTPLSNTKILLLDKYYNLVPAGVPGELCIAGDGLAMGYLNNPELTAENFNRSYKTYKSYGIYTLYRTGDLARLLPAARGPHNYNIEFLGRIDSQVKIRGYRIELGEIEAQLLKNKNIRAAVVIDRTDDGGDRYLVAYVVTPRETPGIPDLKDYLSQSLPHYMIPSFFIPIEEIPLTPHGKTDRKRLPAPRSLPGGDTTAPTNEIEKKLAGIWSEILGREENVIGINDNFFDLGGHSLKAAVLISRLHKTFDVNVPLVEIFRLQTIRDLARFIEKSGKTTFLDIEPVEKRDYYELSFNQKRLWFIQRMNPESTAFNIPGALTLDISLDPDLVEECLRRIMARHESLRTGFLDNGGIPFQYVEESPNVPLTVIDISHLPGEEKNRKRSEIRETDLRTPFDISTPPLFRVVLVKWAKTGETGWDFITNIHHIVSDGWSQDILIQDFQAIYESLVLGEPVKEEFAPRYIDFAAWQNQRVDEPDFKKEAHRFWMKKMENGVPAVMLPTDFETDAGLYERDRSGTGFRVMVDGEFKGRLEKTARQNNTTLFTVMFSTFLLLLSDFSRQEEIACSIIEAGRDHDSLNRVIGFFVNSLLFKTHVDADECFSDFLGHISREILDTFQYKSYPLEPVLDELNMKYPEVPIAFNMLNIGTGREETALEPFDPRPVPDAGEIKFDMEVYVTEYSNGLEMFWVCRKCLFAPQTAAFIASEYIRLMDFFAKNTGRGLKDYRGAGKKRRFKRGNRI